MESWLLCYALNNQTKQYGFSSYNVIDYVKEKEESIAKAGTE